MRSLLAPSVLAEPETRLLGPRVPRLLELLGLRRGPHNDVGLEIGSGVTDSLAGRAMDLFWPFCLCCMRLQALASGWL